MAENSQRPHLNIVVALDAEAKPLIHHFRAATRFDLHPFRVYVADFTRIIVGGIGAANAAAAAGFLHGAFGCPSHDAWLNVGVAGHASAPLGSCWSILKVTDASTGRSTYPQCVDAPPNQTASLLTVSQPERAYPTEHLYDMEGAGFHQTASRLATAELAHVVKVVSDSRAHPLPTRPDAALSQHIERLMTGALPFIQAATQTLRRLADDRHRRQVLPPALAHWASRANVALGEQQHLRRLLWRWQHLVGGALPEPKLHSRTHVADLEAELAKRAKEAGVPGDV